MYIHIHLVPSTIALVFDGLTTPHEVGILAFGEGWHNNHHAFERSCRHGLKWWQARFHGGTWGAWWIAEVRIVRYFLSNVALTSDCTEYYYPGGADEIGRTGSQSTHLHTYEVHMYTYLYVHF